MPINANEKGKKPSIHITKEDAENAEDLEVGNKSPSTVYSDALAEWLHFNKLKRQKKKELQQTLNDVREEAQEWGIDVNSLRWRID